MLSSPHSSTDTPRGQSEAHPIPPFPTNTPPSLPGDGMDDDASTAPTALAGGAEGEEDYAGAHGAGGGMGVGVGVGVGRGSFMAPVPEGREEGVGGAARERGSAHSQGEEGVGPREEAEGAAGGAGGKGVAGSGSGSGSASGSETMTGSTGASRGRRPSRPRGQAAVSVPEGASAFGSIMLHSLSGRRLLGRGAASNSDAESQGLHGSGGHSHSHSHSQGGVGAGLGRVHTEDGGGRREGDGEVWRGSALSDSMLSGKSVETRNSFEFGMGPGRNV